MHNDRTHLAQAGDSVWIPFGQNTIIVSLEDKSCFVCMPIFANNLIPKGKIATAVVAAQLSFLKDVKNKKVWGVYLDAFKMWAATNGYKV